MIVDIRFILPQIADPRLFNALGALGQLTMNPPVSPTVAGDLATKWLRLAAVNIVQLVEVATLTDLRLLPTRCRLFLRMVAAVVVVVADDVKSFANIECF
jgi:hypothetical protein